jgi:hypothetical protein
MKSDWTGHQREASTELGADEFLALVISLGVAAVGAWRWYAGLFRVTRLASPLGHRVALGLVPFCCVVLAEGVLACSAAQEIHDDAIYNVLFVAAAGAWLTITGVAINLIGISPRLDAVETCNEASVVVLCGAWIGVTLCYAGGNIGEGATVWTTFIPAAAASIVLFLLVISLQIFSSVADAVTLDRDRASALRLAGLWIAAALILGRSVAGDFHSWQATWRDLVRLGWPVLPLQAAAIILQWSLRPTSQRPIPNAASRGLLPALAMIVFAMIDLWISGLPRNGAKGG